MRTSVDYCTCVTALLLVSLSKYTYANYEHVCYRDDYSGAAASPRNTLLCGRMLSALILQSCLTSEGPTFLSSRTARSIPEVNGVFLSRESANSILDHERQANVGIVCECCVHRCSVNEIRQYCFTPKKDSSLPRRRRRSILRQSLLPQGSEQPATSSITQHDVDKFYTLLDELEPFTKLLQQDPTAEEREQLYTLDQQKLQAIRESQQQQKQQHQDLSLTADTEKKVVRKLKPNRHHSKHHKRHHRGRNQK